MWAARYWNPRYWAARYWPKVGQPVPPSGPDILTVTVATVWPAVAGLSVTAAGAAVATHTWPTVASLTVTDPGATVVDTWPVVDCGGWA